MQAGLRKPRSIGQDRQWLSVRRKVAEAHSDWSESHTAPEYRMPTPTDFTRTPNAYRRDLRIGWLVERRLLATLGVLGMVTAAQAADPSGSCTARSGAASAVVVELYTSEGCSSCPPADRWLSTLATQRDVIALAFHVDYWDNLGWKDPYGSPAFTARQSQQQAVNGSRYSYTPQVTINGVDSRHWPSLRAPISVAQVASPVQVQLSRDGDHYTAVVRGVAGSVARVGAYWAVTENALVSEVKRGENAGARLAHDFVVRDYLPVAPWVTDTIAAKTLSFSPAPAPAGNRTRHVNLVVFDSHSGRPVQAVKLGC